MPVREALEQDISEQERPQQNTLQHERRHLDHVPNSPKLDQESLQIIYDAVAKDDPEALKQMAEPLEFSSNLAALNSSFRRSSRRFGSNPESNGILHGAAELNSMRIAQMFVSEGYDVDTRNAAKWTPLHCAVLNGHAEMADYLLRSGANAGLQCLFGSTALHLLLASGRHNEDKVLEITEILLKHGAPVDQPDSRNHTALTLSARKAYVVVAERLRNHAALADVVAGG
ncbi:hypothetical protein CKM354_000910700 [Cercospora kikuchii]|uniref:Ankyrin repeat protein n=1 Tax=Cercospora kikuchii TaxID=84275 RepID=A0A9P3FIZ3_9PEZI|nr:uncharacterized protein CKM354_000910700 [Cercospora kikuchii]GIZ45962.1 hypothetical protein CKM354_000910700 [Cercospora kikuchii]